MKARAVQYRRARSLEDAIALLDRHGDEARVLAGGQSLVPAMNLRLSSPAMLIDLGGIEAMRGIRLVCEQGRHRLRIGAMTTHADIAQSTHVALHAPLLAKAARHVAHAAIRNRGTFGGSLAYADPSAEWPACALALEADMTVTGSTGARIVAAKDFFLGLHETAIRHGEILTTIDIDVVPEGYRTGFVEFSRRQGDYALAGLAAQGRAAAGGRHFDALALAYFSVGSMPTLATSAATILMDATIDQDLRLDRAQSALSADLDPPSDTQASSAMRLHLSRVLLARVVTEMLDRTQPP